MEKKQILVGIIFTVASILLGYLLYYVFFKSKDEVILPITQTTESKNTGFPETNNSRGGSLPTSQETTNGGISRITTIQGQLPDTSKEKIQNKITNDNAKNISINKEGRAQFYNDNDGKFYEIVNGKLKELSSENFYSVQNVAWSPDGKSGIIEFPDGANIFYDFESKKKSTLPKHWQEFSFAPTNDLIAAKSIGNSVKNQWLVTSKPDGSEIKIIENLGENADKVMVNFSPNKQIIALSRTSGEKDGVAQNILLVGQYGENFKALPVDGRGFESKWSKSGNKILYSIYNAKNGYKPSLWISNANGDSIGSGNKPLNLETWSDKCVFETDDIIYCGVPESLEEGSGLQRGISNGINDILYKIDVKTGIKTEIPISGSLEIESIFLGEDGKSLFYTTKNSTGIFEIKL